MTEELFIESGSAQICKFGEILCGDSISVAPLDDGKLMVLSDGLGSGVKANILATLTTKIALRLMERGLPLEEVVSTLTDTLPECKIRKIAYSTFTLLKVLEDGRVYLAEFDNPPTFFMKRGYNSQLKYRGPSQSAPEKSARPMCMPKQVTGWLLSVMVKFTQELADY